MYCSAGGQRDKLDWIWDPLALAACACPLID
jgi:hypothetical protein